MQEVKALVRDQKTLLPGLTSATAGCVILGESPDLSEWNHKPCCPADREDWVTSHI